MTPLKLLSSPIGIWTNAALWFSLDLLYKQKINKKNGQGPMTSTLYDLFQNPYKTFSDTHLSCCRALAGLEPCLSSLLMKVRKGTPYRFICLLTVIVWHWTPPTAHKTRTAPSNTLSDLSTSIVKSTWPRRHNQERQTNVTVTYQHQVIHQSKIK